jgi:hypothetical protein
MSTVLHESPVSATEAGTFMLFQISRLEIVAFVVPVLKSQQTTAPLQSAENP